MKAIQHLKKCVGLYILKPWQCVMPNIGQCGKPVSSLIDGPVTEKQCSNSVKPTNHFSTLLLLNLCVIEYLVLLKVFLLVWAADYFPPHYMLFLYTVS